MAKRSKKTKLGWWRYKKRQGKAGRMCIRLFTCEICRRRIVSFYLPGVVSEPDVCTSCLLRSCGSSQAVV
jgi:hypothetical protein